MSDDLVKTFRDGLQGVTPGPWSWWTSNSWRRLSSDADGKDGGVLCPYVARDGHPDLVVKPADMTHITNCSPERIAALLDLIERQHLEILSLREAHDVGAARIAALEEGLRVALRAGLPEIEADFIRALLGGSNV